jgi:hypothetical protein
MMAMTLPSKRADDIEEEKSGSRLCARVCVRARKHERDDDERA